MHLTHGARHRLPIITLMWLSLFSALACSAQGRRMALLGNGGFEDQADGVPVGWEVNNAGKLSVSAQARSGASAARFDAVQHPWGFCAFASSKIEVSTCAVYEAGIWAKGRGQLELAFYQYSKANFVGTQFMKPRLELTGDWQQLHVIYKGEDPRMSRVAFAVHLYGEGSVAALDEASFTFDPEANPGVSIDKDEPAVLELQLQLEAHHAEVTLWVAGQAVPVTDSKATARIPEGLVPLCVKAVATGDAPAVAVRVVGHPETARRWRVGTEELPGWTSIDCADGTWPVAEPKADGGLWAAEPDAPTILLRQLMIWNATHYGPNRCIVPPVREWGFPRGGFETFTLALYSPLPRRLSDYTFVLDLPAQFALLDKSDYWARYIDNQKPVAVETEPLQRDGRAYVRYRLSYRVTHVKPEQTQYSLLPVKMVGNPDHDAYRFYYRRLACGNLTELEQAIPVRILPAVNGRRPERVMISQYSPGGYTPLSAEHLRARLEADAAAGCNVYMLSHLPGWGEKWLSYLRLFEQTLAAAGSRLILWSNYPLNYGATNKGHLAWYPDWIQAHPEAQGRYFRGEPAWGEPRKRPYCNQYVISDEGAAFWDVAKREYARALDCFPTAVAFFADWEFHNLTKDGKGVHCFCDRCKHAFRAYAGIAQDETLGDDVILQEYQRQWLAFRDLQDSEIVKRMVGVSRELGREHLVYSWASNMGFWEACKGKLDQAFVGMPGNSVADSYFQKSLDDYARRLWAQTGLRRAVGQRFVFFKSLEQDGWRNVTVLSNDGFVDPRTWKSQVLRVVAALHGGIDLQNSNEFAGGMRYHVGEATRIISEFEELFWNGERADHLAVSEDIAYPNLLVLRVGDERLVLLFNETGEALTVRWRNLEISATHRAQVFESGETVEDPQAMTVRVPAVDCVAVHLYAAER